MATIAALGRAIAVALAGCHGPLMTLF